MGDPKYVGIGSAVKRRGRRREYEDDTIRSGHKGIAAAAPRHTPTTPAPLSMPMQHTPHYETPRGRSLDEEELLGTTARTHSSSRFRASMAADELPCWLCGIGLGSNQRGLDDKIGEVLSRAGAPGFMECVRPHGQEHLLIKFASGADAERARSLARIDVASLMHLGHSTVLNLALTTVSSSDLEFLRRHRYIGANAAATGRSTRQGGGRPWASHLSRSRLSAGSGVWGSTSAMSTPGTEGGWRAT